MSTSQISHGSIMKYSLIKRAEAFISKAQTVHADLYDYSHIDYKNSHTPIEIGCTQHGPFLQRPRTHLEGSGCPICSRQSRSLTTKQFLQKAQARHQFVYTYPNVNVDSYKDVVTICCPQHGTFSQRVGVHLQGAGCTKCFRQRKRLTKEEFISRAREKHQGFYTYAYVEYRDIHTKVLVTCPTHGEFSVEPSLHIQRTGCPKCRSSHNEKRIRQVLIEKNVVFLEQHRFDDCRSKYPLPFDFYLPQLNTVIEYDGLHHFKPVPFSGSEQESNNRFNVTVAHDLIKTKYCYVNNIKLLRVSHMQSDQIDQIIQNLVEVT